MSSANRRGPKPESLNGDQSLPDIMLAHNKSDGGSIRGPSQRGNKLHTFEGKENKPQSNYMKLVNEMNSFDFKVKQKSEQKIGQSKMIGEGSKINVFDSINNSSSYHAQNF